MPILKNAKKALRVSGRRQVTNNVVRGRTRTEIAKMKANPTADQLPQVFSAIDKAVKKNILPQNRAARLKSQMSKLIAQ